MWKEDAVWKQVDKIDFCLAFVPDCARKNGVSQCTMAGAGKSPFISPNKSIDNLIHPVMSMNPVPWHKSLWDNNDQTLTIESWIKAKS